METLTINCSPLVLSLSNIHIRKREKGLGKWKMRKPTALGNPVAIATQEQTASLSLLFTYRWEITIDYPNNKKSLRTLLKLRSRSGRLGKTPTE